MRSDRTVLIVVPLIALLLAFYFMVLGPKRQEAAALDEDIKTLQTQIDEQEQVAAFAEEARQDFPKYYGRLVVLGKAVPEQADSASLLVQVNTIAEKSRVSFDGLTVAQSSTDPASAEAAAPTAPITPPAEGTSPETTPPATDSGATTGDPTAQPTSAAPATEAAAASLPIGATVGTAGLPTLPYTLNFSGTFFDIADFFAGVDRLVDVKGDGASVNANGRLVTVDGFVLKEPELGPNPTLQATLAVTTFITPPELGLTGGATPGGPTPGAPTTTPATTTAAVVP